MAAAFAGRVAADKLVFSLASHPIGPQSRRLDLDDRAVLTRNHRCGPCSCPGGNRDRETRDVCLLEEEVPGIPGAGCPEAQLLPPGHMTGTTLSTWYPFNQVLPSHLPLFLPV